MSETLKLIQQYKTQPTVGKITVDFMGPSSYLKSPEAIEGNGNGSKHDTHDAKLRFANSGDNETATELTPSFLTEKFSGLHIEGELGKQGLLVLDDEQNIVAAVASPTRIKLPNGPDSKVTFGGVQTEKHIEYSSLRKYGTDGAGEIAREIIEAAQTGQELPHHADIKGSEVEAHYTSRTTGEILEAPFEEQEELCRGMIEVALPPVRSVEEGMFDRASEVIKSQKSDTLVVKTSVPITGSPTDSGIGINNGQYKDYVAGMSATLRPHMGPFDIDAIPVGDYIARKMGYNSDTPLEEMITKEPTISYWVTAAGHRSFSLPNVKNKEGKYEVPTEIAIAVADAAASNMGAVAELLTYSSPLIFGEAPKIETKDGEKKQPLDYREIIRHVMQRADAGEFIRTPERLVENARKGIIEGETHTIDRTAFRTEDNIPVHYGPVRIRSAIPESGEPQGRIEFTGCGVTPSLLDEAARDILLDMLKLAAIEAVAKKNHPAEQWGGKYPSLASTANRKDITRGYNLNGPDDPVAGEVIDETLAFLEEMGSKYQQYEGNIRFARRRIANLKKEAVADTVEEYAQNPIGPISQVMQKMYNNRYSPLEIAEAASAYELRVAQAIVNNVDKNGEPKPIYTLDLAA